MTVSELIDQLSHLRDLHGEQEVYLDSNEHSLDEIEEVDVDSEFTGIIIWAAINRKKELKRD